MSAGPAFYGKVTGDGSRFAAQLDFLARGSGWAESAASYQQYLWMLHSLGQTGFGSGISAFPSVHVGLATFNALFVWEYDRRLGILAFAYAALIEMSSVYLGWHYAIDGYAAAMATVLIYAATRQMIPDGKTASETAYFPKQKLAAPAGSAVG
jgi:membrane-associated phospholipid phosphatase